MSEHTAGPWELDATDWPIIINSPMTDEQMAQLDADPELRMVDGKPHIVCQLLKTSPFGALYYRDEDDGMMSATALANAKLITAAPELLAACEAVLKELDEYEFQSDNPVLMQLVDAIAKAKDGE